MKILFILFCALSMIGCTTTNKEWDYLGVVPSYAVNAPHAPTCPCCNGHHLIIPN